MVLANLEDAGVKGHFTNTPVQEGKYAEGTNRKMRLFQPASFHIAANPLICREKMGGLPTIRVLESGCLAVLQPTRRQRCPMFQIVNQLNEENPALASYATSAFAFFSFVLVGMQPVKKNILTPILRLQCWDGSTTLIGKELQLLQGRLCGSFKPNSRILWFYSRPERGLRV